jgi:hypothetical protein
MGECKILIAVMRNFLHRTDFFQSDILSGKTMVFSCVSTFRESVILNPVARMFNGSKISHEHQSMGHDVTFYCNHTGRPPIALMQ